VPVAAKVRKQFLLDPELLQRAREALNARTDTETVERALSSIVTDDDLWKLQMAMAKKGVDIVDVYGRART